MKGTAYWTLFMIAAIVILVLASLHMAIMHFSVFGAYNPGGVAYKILLAAALYHGLYGLRTIIFELGPKKSFQAVFTVLLWILGLILFGIGAYTDLIAKSVGKAL